jgi:hypothetical protein
MKSTLLAILAILASATGYVCGIWVVIEFILYVAKDDPFYWGSLWFTILSYFIAMLSGLMGITIKNK